VLCHKNFRMDRGNQHGTINCQQGQRTRRAGNPPESDVIPLSTDCGDATGSACERPPPWLQSVASRWMRFAASDGASSNVGTTAGRERSKSCLTWSADGRTRHARTVSGFDALLMIS
jgi:hypothetical protein